LCCWQQRRPAPQPRASPLVVLPCTRTQAYSRSIRVTNRSKAPVEGYIKAASSDRYNISPGSFRLRPGEALDVAISLKVEPKFAARRRAVEVGQRDPVLIKVRAAQQRQACHRSPWHLVLDRGARQAVSASAQPLLLLCRPQTSFFDQRFHCTFFLHPDEARGSSRCGMAATPDTCRRRLSARADRTHGRAIAVSLTCVCVCVCVCVCCLPMHVLQPTQACRDHRQGGRHGRRGPVARGSGGTSTSQQPPQAAGSSHQQPAAAVDACSCRWPPTACTTWRRQPAPAAADVAGAASTAAAAQ
jgi:hypothetical protein